jgi:hypothetical protein
VNQRAQQRWPNDFDLFADEKDAVRFRSGTCNDRKIVAKTAFNFLWPIATSNNSN